MKTIANIGILTCEKSALLERCIGSQIEALRRERAGDLRWIVADDSRGEPGSRLNRGVLEKIRAKTGARIEYAGRKEKLAWIDQLREVDASLDPEALSFALLGTEDSSQASIGANRNSLLLLSAGERALSLDDDTIARFSPGEEASASVDPVRSAAPDPTEFVFFADWASSERSATAEGAEDWLRSHEEILGKDHVVLSASGIIGDSGMGTPSYYLRLRGVSRARLLESESRYRSAIRNRLVKRVVSTTTLSGSNLFQTFAYGFDHREILPPFFPIFRSEDTLFAIALKLCIPGPVIAHVPWAILHQPDPPRATELSEFVVSGTRPTFRQLLAICLRSCAFPDALQGRTDRMTALGEHLEFLASRPMEEITGFLLEAVVHERGREIGQLEALIEANRSEPGYWADDVREYAALLRRQIETKEEGLVVPPGLSLEACLSLVGRYGHLLRSWPGIWKASREADLELGF